MKKFAKVFVLLAPLVLSSCNMGKPQVTAKSLSVSDKKAFNYHVGEVFDNFVNNGGLKVNVTMSDDSVSLAEKGTFTYQITEKNNPNKKVDGTQPFTTAGDYVVTVSKEQLTPVSESIKVLEKEEPHPETATLTSISVSEYTNEVYQNETYTFDGTVTATYSDGNTKDVTSKATIGTISTETLGNKSLSISYTEGTITKTTSVSIDVISKSSGDVPVTGISLSDSNLSIERGKTAQLTATIYPSNATDNEVIWDGSANGITVNSNGLVSVSSTASVGATATIVAKAHGDTSKTASCVVTVIDNEEADPNMKIAYEVANELPDGDITDDSYSFSGVVIGTRTSETTTRKTTTSKDVFVQSGDYGIDLFNSGFEPSYKDKVEVTSTLTKYYGIPETKRVSSLNNKGQDKLPKAKQITSASDLASTKLNTLVDVYGTVKSMSLTGSNIVKSKDLTIELTTTSGDVQVFAKKNCFDNMSSTFNVFNVGDTMIVKNGIRGIYNSTNQILIVNESEVSKTITSVESVSVSPKSTTVLIGNTTALSANILPADATNKSLIWSSSNTSIATVNSNGVVTGVAAGTASITVKTVDGGFTDSCTVTVSPVSVNGVSLNQTSAKIFKGSTLQLNPTINPSNATNKNVTWSSNNTSVATVNSSGLVSAIKAGTANITVTTVDGNKTATCVVTVSEPATLSSITISGQKTTFNQGDTFTFGGTVTAHYSDGSTSDVTSSATFSGYNLSNVGNQTVTVSYQGKTLTYQITVAEKVYSLSSISVSNSHRTFNVGDTFTKETVTAHYTNGGADKDVTSSAIFTGYVMDKAGTYTVSVSYTEKTVTKSTTYSINVKNGTTPTHNDIIINENLDGMSNGYSSSDGSHAAASDYFVTTSNVCVQSHSLQFKATPGYIYNTTNLPIYTLTLSNNSSNFHVYAGNNENPTSNEITGNNGVYELNGASYFTVKGNGTTCQVTSITLTFGTPTPVNPTSITVSGTNQLTAGQQGQLSLSFGPSNCNQKDVIWSSSNSVVSVDQTGKITASSTASVGQTAVITATSKVVDTVKGSITITIVDKPVIEKADWTIMVYVCGSNLESDGSSATSDILEMLDVNGIGGKGADVNVILETGGCSRWRMGRTNLSGQNSISNSEIQRWEIANGKMVYKESDLDADNILSKQSTLESFLEWGIDNYSAEKYGLIMWNHGGGIAGCCYDDNYLDSDDYEISLSTADVAKATENALDYGNIDKFELIAYDCCLMQCADIASVNASYFNYMAASQETEWDGGYDYDVWLDYLVDNPTIDGAALGNKIVKSFVDEQNSQSHYDQQSSVLDLTKMATLTADFNSFVSALNLKDNSFSTIKNIFKQCTGFGLDDGASCYGLCDFKQFVTKLGSQFSQTSKANTVLSDLQNVVIYNYYGSSFNSAKPCGLNAFFATTYNSEYGLQPGKDYYSGTYNTKFTGWQTYLLKNGEFVW